RLSPDRDGVSAARAGRRDRGDAHRGRRDARRARSGPGTGGGQPRRAGGAAGPRRHGQEVRRRHRAHQAHSSACGTGRRLERRRWRAPARVLHAVNALAAHAVPRHELEQLGTRLGADVAFFASGAATALAWGRGERLFRLAAPPAAPVLVAVPAVSVSTPDAYHWWDEMHPEPAARGPVVLDAETLGTWGSIGRLGGNDFEVPVFSRHPTLRAVFERLAQTAPLWVRLCGSGAAVAATYRTARDRDDGALPVDGRLAKPIATTTRTPAAA